MKEEKKENLGNESKEEMKKKNNNTKGLKIFVVILIIVIFIVLGIIVYNNFYLNGKNSSTTNTEEKNKNKNQENDQTKKNDESKETTNNETNKAEPLLAIAKNRKVGLFDENFNEIWSYDTDDYIPSADIAVEGNYVYFAVRESGSDYSMIANLYRINIKKQKVENLDIKLKYPWNIFIENNQFLYTSLFDYHIVNLDTKEDELLYIKGNNSTALINGNIIYTNKDDGSLSIYNIKTKENTKIADDARIAQSSEGYVVYVVNNDNKYYLYDVANNKKTYLYQSTYSGTMIDNQNMMNFISKLYKDTLYIVEKNTIYTLTDNKLNKIYELSLNENESISRFIPVNSNKFFMTKFIEEGDNCSKGNEICGPVGTEEHFILNVENNKIETVNMNDWLNNAGNIKTLYLK